MCVLICSFASLLPHWVIDVLLLQPGPLFFVLASESFPAHVRSEGLSLSNALAWLFNILIIFAFPVIIQVVGSAATFAALAVIGGICVVSVAAFISDKRQEIVY